MQGLRQQILTAPSAENITELLDTGKTYEFASNTTKNGWKNAARRRLAALKGEKVVAVVAPQEEEVVDTAPKKKRGNKKKDHSI